MWDYSNLTYYGFKQTLSIPVSIMSELDANREVMQEQQQTLQYEFDKLQAQQAADQKTENLRGFSIALFVLAFAFVDIAVALYSLSKSEHKEAEYKKRKTNEEQRKVLEDLERDHAIV